MQAILAFSCSFNLSKSLCFGNHESTSAGGLPQNRNMNIATNSMMAALTVDQALKLDQDLPPKYEEILEGSDIEPPPKFEDVTKLEEQSSKVEEQSPKVEEHSSKVEEKFSKV